MPIRVNPVTHQERILCITLKVYHKAKPGGTGFKQFCGRKDREERLFLFKYGQDVKKEIQIIQQIKQCNVLDSLSPMNEWMYLMHQIVPHSILTYKSYECTR